jgi:hypothetical protein
MSMFPFTLWHGTSAHFLPMMEEHGLGGQNPMADWRVLEFLTVAMEILDEADDDLNHPDTLELMPILSAVKGGANGMNFEYGDVYVAGGCHRAADYAMNAPELISFVRTVLEVGDRRGDCSVRNGLSGHAELVKFLGFKPRPVVLKLPPLPLSLFQEEDGGEVHFPTNFNYEADKVLYSQMAYRLTTTIPFEGIEVVDVSGHTYSFNS